MWKTHSISSLSKNIFLSLLFVITNKANRLAWAQRQAKANAFVTVLYYEIDMQEVTPIKLGPNLQPKKCCYLSACQHHCLLASSLPACLACSWQSLRDLLISGAEHQRQGADQPIVVLYRQQVLNPAETTETSGQHLNCGLNYANYVFRAADSWSIRFNTRKKRHKNNCGEVTSILSFTLTWPLSHEGIIGSILWCAKTTSDLIYTTITPLKNLLQLIS